MTPTASVAVNELIETVSEVDVAGIENAVTVGAVVSTDTEAFRDVEIFPAASFAQAYSVFAP